MQFPFDLCRSKLDCQTVGNVHSDVTRRSIILVELGTISSRETVGWDTAKTVKYTDDLHLADMDVLKKYHDKKVARIFKKLERWRARRDMLPTRSTRPSDFLQLLFRLSCEL